jgi:hypothetical protein
MNQSPWEANTHLIKKQPTFYGIWGLLPCSKEPATGPLSLARRIQSTPSHPIYPKQILILSSYVRLDLSSPFKFSDENLVCNSPHTCYMLRPSHPPRFCHPYSIRWSVRVVKFSKRHPKTVHTFSRNDTCARLTFPEIYLVQVTVIYFPFRLSDSS